MLTALGEAVHPCLLRSLVGALRPPLALGEYLFHGISHGPLSFSKDLKHGLLFSRWFGMVIDLSLEGF